MTARPASARPLRAAMTVVAAPRAPARRDARTRTPIGRPNDDDRSRDEPRAPERRSVLPAAERRSAIWARRRCRGARRCARRARRGSRPAGASQLSEPVRALPGASHEDSDRRVLARLVPGGRSGVRASSAWPVASVTAAASAASTSSSVRRRRPISASSRSRASASASAIRIDAGSSASVALVGKVCMSSSPRWRAKSARPRARDRDARRSRCPSLERAGRTQRSSLRPSAPAAGSPASSRLDVVHDQRSPLSRTALRSRRARARGRRERRATTTRRSFGKRSRRGGPPPRDGGDHRMRHAQHSLELVEEPVRRLAAAPAPRQGTRETRDRLRVAAPLGRLPLGLDDPWRGRHEELPLPPAPDEDGGRNVGEDGEA